MHSGVTSLITMERLLEFPGPLGTEFSPDEVRHAAKCDDCSQLLVAGFREYRTVAWLALNSRAGQHGDQKHSLRRQ
jgi:hypothetical protein